MEYDFEKIIHVRSPIESVYGCISDNAKTRKWFPEIWIVNSDEQVDYEYLKENKIRYLFRINKKIKNELVKGMVESFYDENYPKLCFQIKLKSDSTVSNWTQVQVSVVSPILSSRKIEVFSASGTILVLAALGTGFGNMSSAYAATAVATSSSTMISTPVTSKTIAASGVVVKGTTISKTTLTAIMMSIITVAGGGVIGDTYYSDPNVEYAVYPAQIPAELSGVSLVVGDVYSTDDKSEIINYDCNNESIVHDLHYSFECIAENSLGNKESVITTVSVKEPNNLLGADATQCVEQYYYPLSDEFTSSYTYLSNLPNASPSSLSNYKNTHIKLMDDYFEDRDYTNAKKHATIVLKYFNINDIQALSTLGNIMRDEDRTDIMGAQCAIAVHSTPFLYHTAWGKISLAEDYHVLHDFKQASSLASLVIDDYNNPKKQDVHEVTYKNALIIKANALFRMAMAEQANDIEEIRKYYTLAHEIEPSYDSWFGLGNLDRYVSNFDEALEKYEQAKKLAKDTAEIDYEIDVMKSYMQF